MAVPYIGEIRMFAGTFAPVGWAFCNGQEIPISENDVLFTLIGTTYGGDGEETFNLPDLRGRLPLHRGGASGGTSRPVGALGGTEQVTLSVGQMPAHTHAQLATTGPADQAVPSPNTVLAASTSSLVTFYGTDEPHTPLAPGTIGLTGGSQPHDNMQPYLCVSFIISLFGIFPSPT
jgi:microcystin-dependent protein